MLNNKTEKVFSLEGFTKKFFCNRAEKFLNVTFKVKFGSGGIAIE